MTKDLIFLVVGGLGLFLFGMGIMSDGLKKIAGNKLRKLLDSITKHRVVAVLIGALVTCLVQSSSATTVMVVGFVNAGLLSLKQALCVVLGANIGTTFTAWLVSILGSGLKITAYALPAVGIGFALQVIPKKQKWRSIGSIMLGFGLLFVGIGFMKDAFKPLRDSAAVIDFFVVISKHPLMPILAVLAGTVITVLLQSSSASIAMVQIMAIQGLFGTDLSTVLSITIPFILGDNIGTTITAQLAALRANRNSKRVAWGHTMFNVLGVVWILPIVWFGWYSEFIIWMMDKVGFAKVWEAIMGAKEGSGNIAFYIAMSHSMFNIVNTIVFVPIVTWLEKVVLKLLPVSEEEKDEKPAVLEEHLLATPEIALEQSRTAILQMAKRCRKAFNQSMEGLINNDPRRLAKASRSEDLIDDYQEQITSYLVALSQRQLSEVVSTELPVLLHSVNDLERVGDHAQNIIEIAHRKAEQKIDFTDFAMTEMTQMVSEVYQMLDSIVLALEGGNGISDVEAAKKAFTNEKNLNRMQIEFRRNHVSRLSDGKCNAQSGLMFVDVVDNIEKIGDHLNNVAQGIIGGLMWDGAEKIKEATKA